RFASRESWAARRRRDSGSEQAARQKCEGLGRHQQKIEAERKDFDTRLEPGPQRLRRAGTEVTQGSARFQRAASKMPLLPFKCPKAPWPSIRHSLSRRRNYAALLPSRRRADDAAPRPTFR